MAMVLEPFLVAMGARGVKTPSGPFWAGQTVPSPQLWNSMPAPGS